MKEKIAIILGVLVAMLVIITLFVYIVAKDAFELFDLISIAIVLILVGSATYIIWDRIKNIKAGLPVQDERLKIATYKAGYYGFIAAIWSEIVSNLAFEIIYDQELRGGLVVAAVVIVSGLVFMISYFYLSRKGDIE